MSAGNSGSPGAPEQDSAPQVSPDENPPLTPSDADTHDAAKEISDLFTPADARRKPLRSIAPRDSVQPRGIQGISRIPPAATVSRRPPAGMHTHDDAAAPPQNTPSDAPEDLPEMLPGFRSRSANGGRRPNDTNRNHAYPSRPSNGTQSRWPSSFKPTPDDETQQDAAPPRSNPHPPSNRRYGSGGYSRGRYGAKNEPLSLAEELANEMSGDGRPEVDEVLQLAASLGDHTLAELQRLTVPELIEEARKYHLQTPENADETDGESAVQRHELVFRILQEKVKQNGLMYGEGTLEILPDGFGFLRSMATNYISCPDDIYVSPSQIRRFGLQNGNVISGQIRPPKENERYFALLRVEAINFRDPNDNLRKKRFDELTPTHPSRRLTLEAAPDEVETRVTDMMIPIGFGQRGLIVSPPRAGKTILLQKIAKAALKNFPDIYIFMLLIDERPEEVTDMERALKCTNCEVISSTFDETPGRHIQVAQMVMEKAKRMVECGQNVVILLDSITRLARAYNAECEDSGKTLSGGIDANALQEPKRFFGNARCVEEGGSLTIIATALVETGSLMDDLIFEEFKGTGNLEIVLDKQLSEQRIWPSIDLTASGTRRDEMLMPAEEFEQVCKLRRLLGELNPIDAMEMLTNRLRKTKTNAEFLAGIS